LTYHDISPADAESLLARDGLIVIDMRDAEAQAKGALPGARPASDAVVNGIVRQRRADPAVLVYCYHGNMSRDLCSFLSQLGLNNVYNLNGGWSAWENETSAASGAPHAAWCHSHGFEPAELVANAEYNNMTPLMMGALEGNHAVVDDLLAAGVDVNGRNGEGHNALWFACVSGDIAMIEKLIAHGGDPDNRNVNGFTCAMYAASMGRLEVLKALVDGGADLTIRSPDGLGALESAATLSVLRYLRPLVPDVVPA
jgi:rhodanese-related sulfurtransferase